MTPAERDRLLNRIRQMKAAEDREKTRTEAVVKLIFGLIGFFLYPVFLMSLMAFLYTQWPAVPAWGYWRCLWILVLVRMCIWGVARAWKRGVQSS